MRTLIGAAAVTAQAADNAPVVQPVTAQTRVDIAVEAELSAADADNDVVLYQLTESRGWAQRRSRAVLLLHTGPQSRDATASTIPPWMPRETQRSLPLSRLRLKKNKTGLTYRTWTMIRRIMRRSIYRKKGVMTGETIGSCAFFHPNRPVTRSEFIVTTAAAADLSVEPTDQTDFADDSDLPRGPSRYQRRSRKRTGQRLRDRLRRE